jgi:Transposase DDE domain
VADPLLEHEGVSLPDEIKHREDRPAAFATAKGASSVDTYEAALKTKEGRAAYALRKQTVEPVFGIPQSVMRFIRFCCAVWRVCENEWALIFMALNLKRIAILRPPQESRTKALPLHGKTT